MKKEKQLKVLELLQCGKYKVDFQSGVVYSYRKAKDQWLIKRPLILGSGYKQQTLFTGRGHGKGIFIYEHIFIYIAKHGVYEEGMVIDHIDANPSNNRIDNLRLCTHKQNSEYANEQPRQDYVMGRFARGPEIIKIIELYQSGWSQSKIARFMGMNRLTVRHTVKKYERKEKFQYLPDYKYS